MRSVVPTAVNNMKVFGMSRLPFYFIYIYISMFVLCEYFNNFFNISDYVASKDRIIINSELYRMYKETLVA